VTAGGEQRGNSPWAALCRSGISNSVLQNTRRSYGYESSESWYVTFGHEMFKNCDKDVITYEQPATHRLPLLQRLTSLLLLDTAREHGCHFGHPSSRAVLVK